MAEENNGKKLYERYVKAKTEYYNKLLDEFDLDFKRFREIPSHVPDNIFDLFLITFEGVLEDNKIVKTVDIYKPYKEDIDKWLKFNADVMLMTDMNAVIHKYGFEKVEGIVVGGRRMLDEKAKEDKSRSMH